jgi:hypothetical protein
MASIRRYGPSLVAPQVSPRPDLGNGQQATFAAFENVLAGANEFIRPAVVRNRTAQGEKEALASVDETGAEFDLVQTRGPGNVAIEAVEGQAPQAGRLGPTRTNAAIQTAARENGVDPLALSVIAQIESSGNPSAQNPNSTAGGLFQQLDANALEFGVDDRFDPYQSASGAARFMVQNTRVLSAALGRQPTISELYLAHQQGGGGAAALLGNPTGLAAETVGMDEVLLNGGTAEMTNQEFANKWIERANREARRQGGTPSLNVDMQTQAEYELQQTNASSFEPRQPFTVRDAAFNAAADRVIQSRAMTALDQGIAAAQQRADGDLGKLREEMEKVRNTVMGGLPDEMPNLATALEESFTRSAGVAEGQAIELAQRRVVAQQTEAMATTASAIQGEAERLALTGAGAGDIAAHLTSSQAALAQFGPRQAFELNGQYYPPDPTRAGTMSPSAIGQQLGSISTATRRIMIEAEFQKSAAPGQFVEEFRRQVMSGNSPLPAGESLDLLRQLDGRARATESARRTEANAARALVEQETDTRINAFVEMTEAGVPVAIPQAERDQILRALSPFPKLQREALEKFAVADAAVITHGMAGSELLAYVDTVRGDLQASVERGELDTESVAIIQSLEDSVSKIQDAITAEQVGIPFIEQTIMDGATADEVNYDGLREQAAGNQDILNQIAEIEAFHRDMEEFTFLTADERAASLEVGRSMLEDLAASGDGFGSAAVMTGKVVDRLEEYSNHLTGLAENDAMKYAEAIGVPMATFEGAENLGDLGSVIASRITSIKPATMNEGVDNPVPMSRAEVDFITETFAASTRGEQTAFLGSVAALGEDQANAIFAKVGASEPTLFAAGTVYVGGNQTAASIILRGSVDTSLEGGSRVDVARARQDALGNLLSSDILRPDSIAGLDAAALAYARGLAMIDGGRPIEPDDLSAGFNIAMGKQENGTGGIVQTNYGTTIAPRGWLGSNSMFGDELAVDDAIASIDDVKLTELAQGLVLDRSGRPFSAAQLLDSIEGLRPDPTNPNALIPTDADGAFFKTENGSEIGILSFDLELLK